jgi:hypothetical protein
MGKRSKRPGTPEAAAAAPPAESLGRQRRHAARAGRRAAAPAGPTQPVDTTGGVAPRPTGEAGVAPTPHRLAPLGDAPVFWFGFEVTWAKLVLARVVVFAMLAIDALLQVRHAPRYGAGDFNVAHLSWLDALGPGRVAFGAGQLVLAYLFVLAACGVATRWVLPIATGLYGWLYFGSQLDSYQHHYLVWLVVALGCVVPWQRPADATAATRVRSWAVRLVLVQLAILYLWAAVSKLGDAWLDGRTLSTQLHGGVRGAIESTIGMAWAARLVVIAELVLAATIWLPRAWWLAAPLGLAFHAGIVFTNLEIGLFAWLMIGIYILVVPDRIWVWIATRAPIARALEVGGVIGGLLTGGGRWLVAVVALAAGGVLAAISRFEHGLSIGLALLGVAVATTIAGALRRWPHVAGLAAAHLVALVTWTVVDRTTTVATDYYRFWGGTSRRLGDRETAERAYRRLVELAPDQGQGHFQLGKLLLARGAHDEGLAALHRAQVVEPARARAYVEEARWLLQQGRRDEALFRAREAMVVEPTDPDARALLDGLERGSR